MDTDECGKEPAARAATYLKAELKRGGMTYSQIAEKLKEHGFQKETENSIKAKLKRGTFTATFFLATLKALGKDGIRLEDI